MTEKLEISRISAVIGTAGHIDHGKTSLVKALTGMDTDTLKEEKRRGLSIVPGFAHMDVTGLPCEGGSAKTTRIAIIDLPGHERFIRNMLAGVSGIDMVLFAVAADDGVMPQTIEHLDIVNLLGLKTGIFVITKKDLAGEERVREVETEIRGLVKGTTLEGSPIVSASTVTGEGIEELKCLIKDRIMGFRCLPPTGFFRLPVDRSFTMRGFGTVVTGTVAGGVLKRGDEVICFPGVVKARVRGLQSLHMEAYEVREGERAAVNLSGVSHNDIKRGDMLITPGLSPYAEYAALEEELYVDSFFEFLPDDRRRGTTGPVKSGSILKLHHYTGETLVKTRFAGRKEALPGERLFGRLILKKPLLMLKGDRFILRNPALDTTIGGGTVYMPHLSRATIQKLERTLPPSPEEEGAPGHMERLYPEGGLAGFSVETLSIMLNTPKASLLEGLRDGGPLSAGFMLLGGRVVKRSNAVIIKKKVLSALEAYMMENPASIGMRDEDLFTKLRAGVPFWPGDEAASDIFKQLLSEMHTEGSIEREGAVTRPFSAAKPAVSPAAPSSAPSASPLAREGADKALLALNGLFSLPGFSSVNIADIRGLPFRMEEVDRALKLLIERGDAVRLTENTFISREKIDRARATLIERLKGGGSVKASEVRDMLGCGRKLAIEILEHFDSERLTLRKGDSRVLRGAEPSMK